MENYSDSRNDQSSTSSTNTIGLLSKENATASNAIEVPTISLPKGGGALKGIDEKFEVNSSNGTAGYTIPLPISSGRNGFSPSLSLSYNSGVGNSAFGIGWSLGITSIRRKTEKSLPKYEDGFQEDTFVFSGLEDLVPYMEDIGSGHWQVKEFEDGGYRIKRYRPRIEGSFSKIEKISHSDTGIYWRVTSRDNKVTVFGRTDNTKISDPGDATKIFEWLPEFSYDNKGNYISYEYKQENLDNVPNTVYEKNRISGLAPFSNRYLKRIKYGNRDAYYPNETKLYDPQPPLDDLCFFELVFDFGEHDIQVPLPQESVELKWDYRWDGFSSYRSGFEIRTNRLCKRVLMFHSFAELNGGVPTLVRSLDIEYLSSDQLQLKSNQPSELTYLTAFEEKGYVKNTDGSYSAKALPKVSFDYQWLHWNTKVQEVTKENLTNAPTGLSGNYQWIDLYSEGINGILTEQANSWFYKRNLGADEQGNVQFTQGQPVIPKPIFLGISDGSLQIQDLEANGSKQLVVNGPGPQGYFELNDEEQWQPFKTYIKELNIDLRNPNVRMFDLDGDGRPEVVLSDQGAFWWWKNEGKVGYDSPKLVPKPYDEELGPSIVFQDQQKSIFLADMTGDGLTDIVRIKNGEICYWANLGYGRFSAKVTMGNAPLFDSPEHFNPQYLKLADISGTGVSDIIYLGKNSLNAYLNLSGNSWSEPTSIDPFFSTEAPNTITVTDLLGNGTACIVWSSELPGHKNSPMRYIDLMGGEKPHIMRRCENGLGKTTMVEYKSSTSYYLQDKKNGKPWITKLPFPVQCVSKVIVTEDVTKVRFAKEYSYHHGYYDHDEREFRGFGRVDQIDSESFEVFEKTEAGNVVTKEHHQPAVLTKTWYHTGAFLDKNRILTQFRKEYWHESFKEKGFGVAPIEHELPDATITKATGISNVDINTLNVQEYKEALRACKGMMLRTEVFSLDAQDPNDLEQLKKQATPYTVATHNCEIQLLQQKHENKHAVYMVKESEAITYAYERDAEDPRIAHSLNIETDQYGHVLESVSVVYPRLKTEDLLKDLPTDTAAARAAKQHARNAQNKSWITFSKNDFTNDISTQKDYQLRRGWQTRSYELTGIIPKDDIFTIDDFKGLFSDLSEIEYHQQAIEGETQKRLVEHVKTSFYDNDLLAPLPDGQLGVFGIAYENYQLAYTPNLLQDLYTPSEHSVAFELTDSDMLDGKYYLDDTNWWIRSGTSEFFTAGESIEDVKSRFLSPVSYTDPLGARTEVFYDPLYLFIDSSLDAIGNRTQILEFNYRTLSPVRMMDINDNISSVIMDELRLVKAIAIEGKDTNNDQIGEQADTLIGISELTDESEQLLIDDFFATAQVDDICNYTQLQALARDLLQSAGSRLVYNFDQKPTVVASIIREQHSEENPDSPLQISFEYSDGFGKVAMVKVQAEPGNAKKANQLADGTWQIETVDTVNQLRWVGNGRTVLNNKGNPIKQYEPYFSVSPVYEDAVGLVETGVTPILFYDGVGRLIKTELPNGTFTKKKFDSWKHYSYDTNDTVKDSKWYADRILLADSNSEKKAALKAELHHDTPNCIVLDTLGRPAVAITQNRSIDSDGHVKDDYFYTYSEVDIEGNALLIIDSRGNKVMEYGYDLLGHRVVQSGMDAGKRWMFNNVMGSPVKMWDERKHEFSIIYDVLQRPLEKWVMGGEATIPLNVLYEKVIYGEDLPNDKQNNLRGKVAIAYDTAGKITSGGYDFKGNQLSSTRIYAQDYKTIPNWDIVDPDSLLETGGYSFTTALAYDALNRYITQTQPDGSEYVSLYNPAGFLERVAVTKGSTTTNYVENINYDEKGQRLSIVYGNQIRTQYQYDAQTFRLKQLRSTKNNGEVLQDLNYTYDPTGNISEIQDKAIPTVFFNNQKITGKSEYTYDALYRLITATGREQSSNTAVFNSGDNWNDAYAKFNHVNGDPMAMHLYTQKYQYDSVGNILQLKHIAGINSWTRDYVYESRNNRLRSTDVGESTHTFEHHEQHGFILNMPHLPLIEWNFKEELASSSKQLRTDGGTPETTYYVYDGSGQRVRKVTEYEADEGFTPLKKDERIYVGAYEVYRNQNGLERETLHITDDQGRIAMIDTETEQRTFLGFPVGRTTPVQTIRYQLSNHIGSASLELDQFAEVISYEEYHPFGTTSYQAKNNAIRAAAKRYRYTGMERDEETGLAYHSARYYLPWLGRWLNSDPLGLIDGANLYKYARNNPIKFEDKKGTHVTDNPQGMIGNESEFFNATNPTGRYIFTTRGGWIDRSHTRLVPDTFQAIQDIRAGRDVTISNNGLTRTYYVGEIDRTDRSVVEATTIAIVNDFYYRYEQYQESRTQDVVARTPFSYEDLTSNRVGIEMGIRSFRNLEDSGADVSRPVSEILEDPSSAAIIQSTQREVIHELNPVSKEQAREHYYNYLGDQSSLTSSGIQSTSDDAIGLLSDLTGVDLFEHIRTARDMSPVIDIPQNYSVTPYYDPVLSPVEQDNVPTYLQSNPPQPTSIGISVMETREGPDIGIRAMRSINNIPSNVGESLRRLQDSLIPRLHF